ncbi:hypothetical protein Cgig2_010031 [Carnegiea gigantea]|uniref:Uncharacterized protein n=1 Tax=Carnegiea gigantea TaxID=171969 RepID=A0A9Q1JLF2_9CARY|nr:hypothetical protein Cgig2_010031 [Carnegiea gigantea]
MEAANSTDHFLILIKYLPLDACLPTGRTAYRLPVTQSGSGRRLGRTRVVEPEWSTLYKATWSTRGSKVHVSFDESRSPHNPRRRMKSVRQKSWPLFLEAIWKAQLRGAQQVLTTKQGTRITVPTMVFGGKEAPRFTSLHNDPLLIEMKIASGSFIDIITWDCLKKFTHLGRDIIPLVHPILGFGRQEVNPTGMIHLPTCFGDKLKDKNLEVDFLVIDVPMSYNVILGRPALYKVKAVITPYFLQLQFEVDDGSMGEIHGDQRTAQECYLVSIQPLVE